MLKNRMLSRIARLVLPLIAGIVLTGAVLAGCSPLSLLNAFASGRGYAAKTAVPTVRYFDRNSICTCRKRRGAAPRLWCFSTAADGLICAFSPPLVNGVPVVEDVLRFVHDSSQATR
jgi:hypothetical protein